MANSPVTELVQNPLRVSFPEFIQVFAEKMEPILLAQPGLLSVTTGVVIDSNGGHQQYAVSIAQWESLEAHEAFLKSPAAPRFFEAAKPLLAGPPTIHHYELGDLSSTSLRSRYSRIFKSSPPNVANLGPIYERHVGVQGNEAANTGPCIEVQGQSALVLFGSEPDFVLIDNGEFYGEWFTVLWHRNGEKAAVGPNL